MIVNPDMQSATCFSIVDSVLLQIIGATTASVAGEPEALHIGCDVPS